MFEIGRLCVKIAGRDAGKKCVIIDVLDENYVLIDGQTRRRKCNLGHLEPLDKIVKIAKGASNKDVVAELKKEKIECEEKKEKPAKEQKPRQKKQKKVKPKQEKKPKAEKKPDKKPSKEEGKKVKKEEKTKAEPQSEKTKAVKKELKKEVPAKEDQK